jgi:hypothetical protein
MVEFKGEKAQFSSSKRKLCFCIDNVDSGKSFAFAQRKNREVFPHFQREWLDSKPKLA